jgi:hypothetical protein
VVILFECLFFTCVLLSSQLQVTLDQQYDSVGVNEFVGWIDGDSFSLDGVQTTNGNILMINKDSTRKGIVVHSHPRVFNSLWGNWCQPSQKDYIGKELLGNHEQYLFCGGNFLIKY